MARRITAVARIGVTVLALGGVAALGGCGGDAAEDAAADTADAAEAAPAATQVAQDLDGEQIFHGSGTCFSCHGQDGVGTPIGPALNDAVWLHFPARPSPEEVSALVKAGVDQPLEFPAPMLPLAGVSLSDAELDAVVTYVLSLTEEATADE